MALLCAAALPLARGLRRVPSRLPDLLMSQLQLIPFLARLAAEAGEMTGVAGVLLINLHNPVEVAECIASLDVIWRGNFVFGVGLGYREVEFDANFLFFRTH